MSDGHTQRTTTGGSVAVGGTTAAGESETSDDRDWIALDLVAGRTYVIDLRRIDTGDGAPSDSLLWGIYDAGGDFIRGTWEEDGTDWSSRLTFTATETGTHHIAAAIYCGRGTCEVDVTLTVRVVEDERHVRTDTLRERVVDGACNGRFEHDGDAAR